MSGEVSGWFKADFGKFAAFCLAVIWIVRCDAREPNSNYTDTGLHSYSCCFLYKNQGIETKGLTLRLGVDTLLSFS